MKLPTALCFICLGLALQLLQPTSSRSQKHLGHILIALVLSIAALTVAQYGFDWSLPLDVVFADPPSAVSPYPGRMGLNTAICLLVTGIAMLLYLHPRWYRLAQWLALTVAAIAAQAMIGYAYGVQALYQFAATTSMAIHTAISLLLLSLGILLSCSHRGIMRTLSGPYEGSRMARWLLPGAVLLPPLLGWIILQGTTLGWYTPMFALSLLVMGLLCGFVAVIWMTAALLNRTASEKKRVTDALSEVTQQLLATLESTTDGFFALNPHWQFTYVNQQAERVFERSRSELLHQNFWEVLSEVRDTAIKRQFYQAAEEQLPAEFEVELPGRSVWLEMRVFPSGRGLAVYFKDVSANKVVEQRLRRSEARLSSFIESNVIGVLIGDVDGGIYEANDELLRIVGYTREDLTAGRLRWTALTPPEYLPLDAERLSEARLRGACSPYEKRYIRKDGSQVPVLVGYGLVGEERWESIVFILDLTELKQLEATLRQQTQELTRANRLKDEFLAVLSHELRTPLNPILGWSQLLQTRNYDSDRVRKALQIIERNARAQVQLIEDLLDISRILRGEMKLQLAPVQLPELIGQTVETVRAQAAAKSIQINTNLGPISDLCLGDPRRLQQMVWNLLANAIKFTPEGGRVEVRLEKVQVGEGAQDIELIPSHSPPLPLTPLFPSAQITVTDTGIGIASDFLPYVFDSFRQADGSSTRSQGGLGLGLAIVQHIVQMHGGQIWVESPGLDQGSQFVVQLPLRTMVPIDYRLDGQNSGYSSGYSNGFGAADAVISSPSYGDQRLRGVKILLVEDDDDNRHYLETLLAQQGAYVESAALASEALNKLDHGFHDLLISDIAMPEMDGYALIRYIRQLPPERGSGIPAIALTAYVDQGHSEAIASGYQHHLAKPVEPEALISAIGQICLDRQLQQTAEQTLAVESKEKLKRQNGSKDVLPNRLR